MKIAYTTETYLIKEITEQTPATRAVKINDLENTLKQIIDKYS